MNFFSRRPKEGVSWTENKALPILPNHLFSCWTRPQENEQVRDSRRNTLWKKDNENKYVSAALFTTKAYTAGLGQLS